ncbi:helix-turn-helix domain-containing protein [Paeniglutamicibacter sp. MACA_103]|uniref:helix-turn-helix domain-containing protein n=1 Tax=Paeniglutamicibacter sp. MACA_103 TaxID=3377337 RepID=UPI0038939D2A
MLAKQTYLSDDADQDQEFFRFLKASVSMEQAAPTLVAADGRQHQVPHELFDALLQIAEALSAGRGVTVMPTDTRMTTQQAADFLGYSRPTLVKLLERGEIAFSKVGRHRRVMLRDLVEYESEARSKRRSALDELARESARDGSVRRVPDGHSTR